MASGSEAATLPATAPRMAEPNSTGSRLAVLTIANAAGVGQQLTHQRMLPGSAADDDIFTLNSAGALGVNDLSQAIANPA
jgi:hypothetical protein